MPGFRSLRARMTAGFTLTLVLALTLAGIVLLRSVRVSAERRAQALLEAASRQTRSELRRELESEERPQVRSELLEESRALENFDLALLAVDAQGQIVAHSRGRIPPLPGATSPDWRVSTFSLRAHTFVVGLYWLPVEAALQAQERTLICLAAICCVFGSLGAWLLVGRTLSPIGRLAAQAGSVPVDSPAAQLHAPSADVEIVELTRTLNSLLARQSEAAAARGRFYAAASHELRTPLQALSGHLELAIARPRTLEEYRSALQEAHTQTGRLSALVRDVLLLNQLDMGPPPAAASVDLAAVCSGALSALSGCIAERGLHVETALPPALEIEAPPTHVAMLASNLLENAVKYASPKGWLAVSASGESGAWRLKVCNMCVLPAEGVARLFEPFHSPEAFRSAAVRGNGLGLAICKAICAANGWSLTPVLLENGLQVCVQAGPAHFPESGR